MDSVPNFARQPGDRIGAQALAASGLLGFAAAWAIGRRLQLADHPSLLMLLFLCCTALPMILLSLFVLKTYRRETSGLTAAAAQIDWRRVLTKYLGFLLTLAVLALAYWLFPEYRKNLYQPVWKIAKLAAIPLAAAAFLYFIWVDRRMREPFDHYWHAGLVVLGKWKTVDLSCLREHALAWTVKGFFLPLMAGSSAALLQRLVENGVAFSTFGDLYMTFLALIHGIDVVWGALGYFLTLRILDSQIRSTEPTALGWISAILCYVPFSTFIWENFLSYRGKFQWSDLLETHPFLYVTWGFAIMVLYAIYTWATVSFGCRFSNLTNRGIITDGPYRFVKHPAYLCKNIAWWLIFVPFLAHSTWQDGARACLCLAATNLIYFIRAKTEERHLLRDPAYQLYAEEIQRHGLGAMTRGLIAAVKEQCFPGRSFSGNP